MQRSFADWKQLLTGGLDQFVATFLAYLPNLFGALALLIIGLIIAGFMRKVIIRLGQWLEQFAQRLGVSAYYLRVQWPISRIIATIGYWLVILFFVTAAAKSLGLPGVVEWLNKLIDFSPSLLIAALIVWFGFIIGDFIGQKLSATLRASQIQQAERVGTAVRLLVITLMIIIGLSHIGIDVKLLELILVVLMAAGLLAMVLAFGLGAGPTVANIIALRNLSRHYQPGQRIRIDDLEGEIVELSKTTVVISTVAGQAMLPARIFQEKTCIILDEDE